MRHLYGAYFSSGAVADYGSGECRRDPWLRQVAAALARIHSIVPQLQL